jgi:hypothetical protein
VTVLALSTNQSTWVIVLIAGLVVMLVVTVLLAGLLRAVRHVETSIWTTWRMGQALAKNTTMTYLLKTVRESSDGLVSELALHRRSGGSPQ